MAQKVHTTLVDDLNGEDEADETVSFGLDGYFYQIDLADQRASHLREVLARYVAHARRQGKMPRVVAAAPTVDRKPNPMRPSTPIDKEQNKAMRDWAKRQGIKVGDKGRIPAIVAEAYQKQDATVAADWKKAG